MLFSDVCDEEVQEIDVRSREAVAVRKNAITSRAIQLAPVRRKRAVVYLRKCYFSSCPFDGRKGMFFVAIFYIYYM